MSAEDADPRVLAENIIEFARRNFEVRTGSDAITVLAIDPSASRKEIRNRWGNVVRLLHPDRDPIYEEGVEDVIVSRSLGIAHAARDLILELKERGIEEGEVASARAEGPPDSPGSGGWGPFAEEKQEEYRTTFQIVKVFFAEQFLGKSIPEDSFDEAVRKGFVTDEDLDLIEDALRQQYGVPELTLDDIARVVASLVVTGSMRLGNLSRMASRTGIFGKGDFWGTGEEEVFDRSRRGSDDLFK